MRRTHPAAGFTLLEAIVTLSIFGILTAIGLPAMRTWLANNQVRAVTDALQNGLRLAQAEALRSSRQVVFALTNNAVTSTTALPLTTAANATSWAIYTLPSMTAGENPTFIQSGILANTSAGVAVNSNGVAALCFNAAGRLVSNTTTVTNVTGAATCAVPTTGSPPAQIFNISLTGSGSDRPLEVKVALGGQVHMCDPGVTLSASHPEGC